MRGGRNRLVALLATLVAGALAVSASPALAQGRCGSFAWCNTSLSASQRAQLMLEAMSQSDKIGILTGGEASDVGLPAIKFTDGAVGAGGVGSGTEDATAMPASIALAANFDRSEAERYGSLVGTEVRHRGIDADFGPTVNIMRTPLGGRTYEGYGEDPFLDTQTAVGWIDGLQAQGVMADVKHFAANNQEGQAGASPGEGTVGGRFDTNVEVDPRWLQEIEFPAFEAAVKQAHSATVMCSYNLVNGAYSCANHYLLQQTLREEWGFPGFVVSDAGACHEPNKDIEAGLDLDIAVPATRAARSRAARIRRDQPATLTRACSEILTTLFAYGFFDHPAWPDDPAQDNVPGDEAVADAAEEGGAVLLKNTAGVLPIDPTPIHSIAVIGPAAGQYIHGNGSSEVKPYFKTTALDGIRARAAAAGITVSSYTGTDAAQAQAAAAHADMAIVVGADTETEGGDKPCMSLLAAVRRGPVDHPDPSIDRGGVRRPGRDHLAGRREQTRARSRAGDRRAGADPVARAGRRTAGGVVPGRGRRHRDRPRAVRRRRPGRAAAGDLPDERDSRLPTAAGGAEHYPGFPIRWTATARSSRRPLPAITRRPTAKVCSSATAPMTSRHIKPAYPFGFGLSYTHFRMSELAIEADAGGGPSANVSLTVTNTGKRTGWAVPELYVSLPSLRGVPQPPHQLKGFAKVQLAPGASQRLSMPLDERALSYWSDASSKWVLERGCDKIAVGSSSRSLPLHGTLAEGGASCAR